MMEFYCEEHEYAFYPWEKEECKKCLKKNTPMNSECFKAILPKQPCKCEDCYWEREQKNDEARLRREFNCSWCNQDSRNENHSNRNCGEEEDEAAEYAHQRELERWNTDDMRF